MSSRPRPFLLVAAAALSALSVPSPAPAQYFGRNKVQYRRFDFEVLRTEHFDIYFYPEEREAVEQTARMAERWYARLSRLLDHQLDARQPVIVYASHPHFEQTNAISGELGESTGGVTELLKRRVVLPLAGPLAETDHVLGHELVHAFQFDISGQAGPGGARASGALRLPLWFIEGMAEYLSLGPVDPHTAMWMRDAVAEGKLPGVEDLDDPEYFPYRWGQALWAYVGGRWGDEAVGRVLKAAGRAGRAEDALEDVLGIEVAELSRQWHEALRASYGPLLAAKRPAGAQARALVTEKHGGGELNLGPALSPDGKQLVFLSTRSLFSIDMYLADAETGKLRRRLVSSALDPHFESLQFVSSAGVWDARGRCFAFGAVRKGRPVLTVLDMPSGRREREVSLPELGEILSPTWSPDGHQLAFSAIVGGLTDLFVYDLSTKVLRRLTDDAFADLQPAWSPDGRQIAFVTDRFTTRLAELRTGPYGLATIDPRTGEVRPLPGFAGAKNINPQWAPDSMSLFFISDRNGISNVYRLDLSSGEVRQVTDLATGASGLTSLSPALTAAASAGRLVLSVYEAGKLRLYAIDSREALAGVPLAGPEALQAASLPPLERKRSEVVAQSQGTRFGLPERRAFEAADYRPRLSLDSVGQPTISVGTDPLGTYLGGGGAFYFSDMLGNRNLGALFQVNGTFDDLAAVVSYANLGRRWSWGVGAGQVPYVTGTFTRTETTLGGEPVLVEQAQLFRQVNREVSGALAYPLSRAQRLEVSAGLRNISFSREAQTLAASLVTGQIVLDRKEDLDAPAPLNFGEAGAALVYDTAIYGATSPILGRRYRLDVAMTAGTLKLTGVLADYRRYFMPIRPYTMAFRLLHYGRYGPDGETDRLQPLFVGYPTLVRGYDTGSFSAAECGPVSVEGCPPFDRLLGTRVAVANAELRFPLFGIFGGRRWYGPVPIELALFGDAGVAWTREDKARFLGGSRDWVRSLGAVVRVNVLGFAILELDFVRPLDRPNKDWRWQFSLAPGF